MPSDKRTALVTRGVHAQDKDGKDVLIFPKPDGSKPVRKGFAQANGHKSK